MNLILSLLFLATIVQCQFFDPVIDDKTYLDRIEEQINVEVETSAHELIQRTKAAEKVTKSYISIKLKDNVFKVLRTLAEMEEVTFQESLNKPGRVGRQEAAESSGSSSSGGGDTETVESEQSEGGDDDSATERQTTPLNGLSTAVKINQNVFQFIGEAIKTIFKGVTGKKNFVRGSANEKQEESSSSSLVQALPTLMKKPYVDQLMGILALLTNDNKDKEAIVVNNDKKVQQSPFQRLFSSRGHVSSTFARKSDGEDTTTTDVTTYIETLRTKHPLLFPDLYRGIPEARRLLNSMTRVVAGINRDEIK